MLIDAAEQIQLRIKNIRQLQHVMQACDPASGVTVVIRQGVWTNHQEERPDRRPITVCEMADLEIAKAIIRQCIEQQLTSLEGWVKLAEDQKKTLEMATASAKSFKGDNTTILLP